jgi:hypothetical protein
MGALQKYNKSQCDEVRETHLTDLAEISSRFLAETACGTKHLQQVVTNVIGWSITGRFSSKTHEIMF